MNNERFLTILDFLMEYNYQLYPFSKSQEKYTGKSGSYIKAALYISPFPKDYLLLIPDHDFHFGQINEIRKIAKEKQIALFAIGKNYVAFEDKKIDVEYIDEVIYSVITADTSLFSHEATAKKFTWVTDIHLNFLWDDQCVEFYNLISSDKPDGVFITGDIAEAKNYSLYLQKMVAYLNIPIYFVFGNHDFYGSSMEKVYKAAKELTDACENLIWLNSYGVARLTETTGIIGHEGWADTRNGNYDIAVALNDHRLIEDYIGLDKVALQVKLQENGDAVAQYFHDALLHGFQTYQHIILLTHVPPFINSCLYQGRPGGAEWLPHFTCKAVGDVLLSVMNQHKEKQLTVLAGHTHNIAAVQALDNLLVLTGEAEYYKPQIQEVFTL